MTLYKMLSLGRGLPLKVSGPGKLMVNFFYLFHFPSPEYLTRYPVPLQCFFFVCFSFKAKRKEKNKGNNKNRKTASISGNSSSLIRKLNIRNTQRHIFPREILSVGLCLIRILLLEGESKKWERCCHEQPCTVEHQIVRLTQ